MTSILSLTSPDLLAVSFLVAFAGGIIKGCVGFGLPMILIASLSTFMPPSIALAGLILPTVISNGMQVFRYGVRDAWETIVTFRLFLMCGSVTLLFAAQLVPLVPARTLTLIIGSVVTLFALIQLSGRGPQPGSLQHTPRLDSAVGSVVGAIGGASGIWGPPTVIYLTAIGTEKRQHMRAQGIIYGLGAVVLLLGHIGSGILNAQTAPFSVALIPPAMLGMWVGGRISDRLNQDTFRLLTLIVLVIGGLNLLRRGLMG